jgi:hypothetical protein
MGHLPLVPGRNVIRTSRSYSTEHETRSTIETSGSKTNLTHRCENGTGLACRSKQCQGARVLESGPGGNWPERGRQCRRSRAELIVGTRSCANEIIRVCSEGSRFKQVTNESRRALRRIIAILSCCWSVCRIEAAGPLKRPKRPTCFAGKTFATIRSVSWHGSWVSW